MGIVTEWTIETLDALPEGTLVGYENEVWRRTSHEAGADWTFEHITDPQWNDGGYETLSGRGLYWYAFDLKAQRCPVFLLVREPDWDALERSMRESLESATYKGADVPLDVARDIVSAAIEDFKNGDK